MTLLGTAARESFSNGFFGGELTAAGGEVVDETLCTVNAYEFQAEGLARHPLSSPDSPKCVLVRGGLGLIADPDTCALTPDDTVYDWQNPLGDQSISSQYLGGRNRCVIGFDPSASASGLQALDQAIMSAGAATRSGLIKVLSTLEATTASLNSTNAQVASATSFLTTQVPASLATAESEVKRAASNEQAIYSQLVALAAADESAMQALAAAYKTLNDQTSTTVNTLKSEVNQCDGQVSSLNNQVNSLTSSNSGLNNQVNSLNNQVSSLNNQVNSLTSTNSGLNNQVNSLNNQVSSLNIQVNNLTAEDINLTAEDNRLTADVSNLHYKAPPAPLAPPPKPPGGSWTQSCSASAAKFDGVNLTAVCANDMGAQSRASSTARRFLGAELLIDYVQRIHADCDVRRRPRQLVPIDAPKRRKLQLRHRERAWAPDLSLRGACADAWRLLDAVVQQCGLQRRDPDGTMRQRVWRQQDHCAPWRRCMRRKHREQQRHPELLTGAPSFLEEL
ncbi:hypothetical protein CEUSTIGMA_g11939.t1 [Chlamydomonas eustigma]|uniref:Uncharacterized protein n=1 Tax=Chlamydomonas eustigma TaxID=1157962 RepID=A0A250XNK2_9CHLO|nr:hypothetical protein CEUSTIGMA_g11939.t1 [Chlamydomonas eustigma]|eukprot:GAX84519.1 hypothetical protein CEUSTIGMA_g11939.t1 [Chlamydomonas eustigma]